MSAHFEVVRSDAEQPWHVRLVSSNGNVIMSSEQYGRRRDALTAIAVAADVFGVAMNRPPNEEHGRLLGQPMHGFDGELYSYDVRQVDERTNR